MKMQIERETLRQIVEQREKAGHEVDRNAGARWNEPALQVAGAGGVVYLMQAKPGFPDQAIVVCNVLPAER